MTRTTSTRRYTSGRRGPSSSSPRPNHYNNDNNTNNNNRKINERGKPLVLHVLQPPSLDRCWAALVCVGSVYPAALALFAVIAAAGKNNTNSSPMMMRAGIHNAGRSARRRRVLIIFSQPLAANSRRKGSKHTEERWFVEPKNIRCFCTATPLLYYLLPKKKKLQFDWENQ
mmetsp:Transcript_33281/g.57498  ORF Transcript_33281/g.57498 Transcript_33281/m.57498 type:complete len:171 (+) Transcript_33281:1043-1555(+)